MAEYVRKRDLFGQLLAGSLDRGLSSAFGLWDSAQQRAAEQRQQDRYYELQRKQYEQSAESREFADAQNLAKLRLESPMLAEVVGQSAYGQKLLQKYGWTNPSGTAPQTTDVEAFRDPRTGAVIENLGDAGVEPPQLPKSPWDPQLGVNGPPEHAFPLEPEKEPWAGAGITFDPAGARQGDPGPLRLDFLGTDAVSLPPTRGTSPLTEQVPPPTGQTMPPLPNLEAVEMQRTTMGPGPSLWDRLGTIGRQREAGGALEGFATKGGKVALDKQQTGTESAQARLDAEIEAAVAGNPDQEQMIRDLGKRLRDSLAESESDQFALGMSKQAMQRMSAQDKDELAFLAKRYSMLMQNASLYSSLARTAAMQGDRGKRNQLIGWSRDYAGQAEDVRKQIIELQNKTLAAKDRVPAPAVPERMSIGARKFTDATAPGPDPYGAGNDMTFSTAEAEADFAAPVVPAAPAPVAPAPRPAAPRQAPARPAKGAPPARPAAPAPMVLDEEVIDVSELQAPKATPKFRAGDTSQERLVAGTKARMTDMARKDASLPGTPGDDAQIDLAIPDLNENNRQHRAQWKAQRAELRRAAEAVAMNPADPKAVEALRAANAKAKDYGTVLAAPDLRGLVEKVAPPNSAIAKYRQAVTDLKAAKPDKMAEYRAGQGLLQAANANLAALGRNKPYTSTDPPDAEAAYRLIQLTGQPVPMPLAIKRMVMERRYRDALGGI
jgi:hypothetical protein